MGFARCPVVPRFRPHPAWYAIIGLFGKYDLKLNYVRKEASVARRHSGITIFNWINSVIT